MTATPSPTLGERLRQLRKIRGLSLRAAAEQVGVHFTYLSKVECDRERFSTERIRALARTYDANPEELLALAGKIPPELQARATVDRDFALLLRALPWLPEQVLEQIYQLVELRNRPETDDDLWLRLRRVEERHRKLSPQL